MENMNDLGKGLPWASSTETLLKTLGAALDQLKSVGNSANKGLQPITNYDAYVERVKEEATITEKGWLEAGLRAGLFQPAKGLALVLFWNLPEDVRAAFLKSYAAQLNEQQWNQLVLNLKQFQLGPQESPASYSLVVAKKWLLGLARELAALGKPSEMKVLFEVENVLLRLAATKVWIKHGASRYEGWLGMFDRGANLSEDVWKLKAFRLRMKGDVEILFPGDTLANTVEKPLAQPLPLLHVYRVFDKQCYESRFAFELPDHERFRVIPRDSLVSIDHAPGVVCGRFSGWGDGLGRMGDSFLYLKDDAGKVRRVQMAAIEEIRLDDEMGEVIFRQADKPLASNG